MKDSSVRAHRILDVCYTESHAFPWLSAIGAPEDHFSTIAWKMNTDKESYSKIARGRVAG